LEGKTTDFRMIDPTSRPQRKSPRLPGYDYSSNGAYFVTICTHQRTHLFGEVTEQDMILSAAGEVAEQELGQIPAYWNGLVEIDCFVVMPNHVHAVIVMFGANSNNPDTQKGVPTLGRVVNGYKGGATRRIRQLLNQPEAVIWQGRYHDHIIRNETGLNKIRHYVANNPAKWHEDRFYGEA
jgi:REP element-mobilizing transposase RayT